MTPVQRRWLAFIGYLAAIYGFLPFGRDVIITLRQSHLLGTVVTLVFFAAVAAGVYHIVFNVRLSDKVAFAALVLLAVATGALVLGFEVPEERVHFLEYGVLALLARHALSGHMSAAAQYLGAWLLASVAGWGDELIQWVLPTRVYDLRDVAVNSVAALVALAAEEILYDRLGWRSRRAK
ncbi:MAG: hypothetical protein GY906_04305 [bacterium]|nr:hypothetical protein [bacterium]